MYVYITVEDFNIVPHYNKNTVIAFSQRVADSPCSIMSNTNCIPCGSEYCHRICISFLYLSMGHYNRLTGHLVRSASVREF